MATSLVKYQLLAVCFNHNCCSADALPRSPFLCNFVSLEDTSIVIFVTTYHAIQIGLPPMKYLINVKYNIRRRSQSTAHEIRPTIRYELNGPGCFFDGISCYHKMSLDQMQFKSFS